MKQVAIFCFLLLSLISRQTSAQVEDMPFAADIRKFQVSDSINPPPQHEILFAGSSSFTMWTDVQDYFPGYTIINRGFGGSTLMDLIRYAEVVIFPYEPKQIVIYCGENDVAYSETMSGEMVSKLFILLFNDIRTKLPDVKVTYISMKPSPSRWHMADRMQTGNKLIKEFLDKQKNTSFVNVWDEMLGPDKKPDPSIFIEDMLHMNAKGYAIWHKKIGPELVK